MLSVTEGNSITCRRVPYLNAVDSIPTSAPLPAMNICSYVINVELAITLSQIIVPYRARQLSTPPQRGHLESLA